MDQNGQPVLQEKSFTLATRCETDAVFADFLQRAAQIELVETNHDGVWLVQAKSGTVKLEAGLDLNQQEIALRRVNGRAWQAEVLNVNGRDLAAESLGRLPAVGKR